MPDLVTAWQGLLSLRSPLGVCIQVAFLTSVYPGALVTSITSILLIISGKSTLGIVAYYADHSSALRAFSFLC